MLKKILITAGIMLSVSMPVHAANTMNTLWETVQTGQTKGLPEGLSGGWMEEITVKGDTRVLFADLSPFSALQIMMRLDAINAQTPLPGYAEVKNNFKSFANYYLDHRMQDEPYGAIGFWPVWKLEDGSMVRAPSADPAIIELMGGSLPADSDDSSQMAIWLLKTEPNHPYVQAYLKMLETIIDENRTTQPDRESAWKDINSGAFMTWVVPANEENNARNNVDCVVNINILTSLHLIKQKMTLSPALQLAEQRTTALVYDVLTKSKFPVCSYYYSRWSHFYLALGKLYESGGGVFTKDQWQVIHASFKKKLIASWKNEKHQATAEWAELLLAAQMFGLSDDAELRATLSEMREYLQQKVHNESYYSLIEGNDVFRGQVRPGMFLLWYVKAQTAATLMEALNIKG